MSGLNASDFFAKKPKLRRRTVAGLLDDGGVELVWENLAPAGVEEALAWWKTNRKTVAAHEIAFDTLSGTYVTVGVEAERVSDTNYNFVVRLLKNYDQAVDWTNARVVTGIDDSSEDSLIRIRFPSIDHDYVQSVASSLKNLKYNGSSTFLTVAGKQYSGEWTALRADVKWEDDGTGSVELWMGDPDYPVNVYEFYGTLRSDFITYYFNLPKVELPALLAAAEGIHGSSVRVSYSNESDAPGTVDVEVTYDGMRIVGGVFDQENNEFDFSPKAQVDETIKYFAAYRVKARTLYFFNRKHSEVLALQGAAQLVEGGATNGWTYDTADNQQKGVTVRVEVRENSQGNFNVTVTVQARDLITDIEYEVGGDFATIDGVLIRVTQPGSESAEYTFAWYNVDEDYARTIMDEKLVHAPPGYFVIDVSLRSNSDEGYADIMWQIGILGTSDWTVQDEGKNDAVPARNESRTMTISMLRRSADPGYQAPGGFRLVATRLVNPDENASDYIYTIRKISTQVFVTRSEDEGYDAHQLELYYPNRETKPTPSGLIGGFDIGLYALDYVLEENPDESLGGYLFRYTKVGTTQHQIAKINYGGDAEEIVVILLNRTTAPTSVTLEGESGPWRNLSLQVLNPGTSHPSYQYRFAKVQIAPSAAVYKVVGYVESDDFEDQIEVYPNVDDDYLDSFMTDLQIHPDSDKVVRSVRSDYQGQGLSNIIRIVLTLPTVDKDAPILHYEEQVQRKPAEVGRNFGVKAQTYYFPQGHDGAGGPTSYDFANGQAYYPTSLTAVSKKIIVTKMVIKVWYEKGTQGTAPSNEGSTTAASYYSFQTHSYRWYKLGYYRHEERIFSIDETEV